MVSIVLVTYSRAHRLQQSIRDILNQTFTDFELIICDDCSPDETQAVCTAFADKDDRIRYFRHDSNLKMPENLNFGIRQARYEYIAILHDGDRFKSDLIEQWYNAITTNPNVGFVFNTIGTTDEKGRVIEQYKSFSEGVIKGEDLLKGSFFRRPRFDSPVYGEAMVRKSLVEQHGYLQKQYGFYADVDLWMEILHDHDAYYCEDMLYTGPSKTILPQLFSTDLIKVFMYLFEMHLTHRDRAFRNEPFRYAKEIIRFHAYTFFYLCYTLLLTIKNFPFSRLMEAPKRLAKHTFLLLPWIGSLMFYPILKPILLLFDLLKALRSGTESVATRILRASMLRWRLLSIVDFLPATALVAHDLINVMEL